MQITKGYIHAKNTIHANYKIMQINVYQSKSAPYIYIYILSRTKKIYGVQYAQMKEEP